MNPDELILSRNGEKHTELRGACPISTVLMLDSISNTAGISRTELVNRILGDWAQKKAHEVNVAHRTYRGNPEAAEAVGLDRI